LARDQHLTHAAGLDAEDAVETRLDKLEALLDQAGGRDAVPLIADVLALDGTARYGKLGLTPQVQRMRTLEALVQQLRLATQKAVLAVLEDAHWIDPTTLELIEQWLDRIGAARVLILLTSRPDQQPALAAHPHVTRLTLNRLGRTGVEAIVARLGGDRLPTRTIHTIIARTDGMPLYVEELTKAVLETGETTIPASLHDSLMARLDRLPEVKEVAQIAACIGRAFEFSLLAAVAGRPEVELAAALDKLAAAELIFRRGSPPAATFTFKHALVQDAAYQSLLKTRRQQLHAHIAQMLEERFPEIVETEPELLARHYSGAGVTERAVEYLLRAGRRAAERSVNLEAISHFRSGLSLLDMLTKTPERERRELEFQITLGAALLMTKGHAEPEVAAVYTRAHHLCRKLGETPELVPVLFGLWRFHMMRPAFRRTQELGQHLLRLAERTDEPPFHVAAHYALGYTALCLGDPSSARSHLEQGVAQYSPEQRGFPVYRTGQDPGVACLAYAGLALWLLGHPEEAVARSQGAIALAGELAHPFSRSFALWPATFLHQHRREPAVVQAQAEENIALAGEHGFALWLAVANILHGWALAVQEQPNAGLEQMQVGLAAWRTAGSKLYLPYFLTLIAEGYEASNQIDEARQVLAEAEALVGNTDERWWEAEVHRRNQSFW
jgi:predicted ATPase